MSTNILSEKLSHKERSVKDLVRFIKTKPGKISNFALLLGAGCSITSGIRSATELSKIWLEEIYENEKGEFENDIKKLRDHFTENHSAWYNPNHEYSSLFEKRYDLPAQRRAFIEEEVADKFPSLGYAYLIRLIENYYFNTIFTTNFDDLINESFHLFADNNVEENERERDIMRPILCAHDSSVKSISITSMRPKIIKLHGDFLFDDIKSTLRETESLEENIRNKFVEFCKEFGLIVVGYSGNDRSIMDVINYLLKSEDYLKNGLYWCIREGDTISDELQKLLWKDRVYYVRITGFDELFAELYEEISSEKYKLPLPQTLPNRNNLIIERLANNSFLQNSKSEIIKAVIEKLKNETKKNSFFNSIKEIMFPGGKLDESQGLSSEETFELFEIDRLRTAKHYNEALDRTKQDIANPDYPFSFKHRLKHIAANILKKQNKFDEAIKYCDEIINDSRFNTEEYFFKNNFLKKYEDKISNLRSCLEKHKYFYKVYENIVHYETELLSRRFNDQDTLLAQIQEDVEAGIKCNPYMENRCYAEQFSCLLSKREVYSGNWYDNAQKIYDIAREQNPDHPLVYDYKRRLIVNNPTKVSAEKKIEDLTELWNKLIFKLDEKFDIYIGQCLLLLDEQIVDNEKIEQIKTVIEKNEIRLQGNISFVKQFSDFYVRKCGNVTKALKLWENISEDDYDFSSLELLKTYYALSNKRDEFEQLLIRVRDNFSSRGCTRLELLSAENRENYDDALVAIRKLEVDESYNYEFFTQKMYAYLCKGNYKEVFDSSNAMLKEITLNCNRMSCDLINYEIARKELNRSVRREKLEEIISSSVSAPIKIAACLLLNKHKEANMLLEDDIKFDYGALLQYSNTFVFKKYLDENIKQKVRIKLSEIK